MSSVELGAWGSHTSDMMIILDEHFRVQAVNPSASVALSEASREIVGCKCTEVLKCRNANRVQLCGTSNCPLLRALLQEKSIPEEDLIIGAQPNHEHDVSVSITPTPVDGEENAIIFAAREIAIINTARRVHANFVSMVSHELRTPLNSVHGFIDLLLQGHMGQLTEEQHTYLGYTQEGVQQLISIVEDILFMTRSDLGQFEIKLQEIHFGSLIHLIQQVIRGLQPQALKAEVVLRHDIITELPSLYADPLRLKQVLNNLITNAIKFTPPGGTVTVSVRRSDDQFEVISVTDTGYGILTEDRPHVFERFYQSNHSEQSKMGGYGLGLTIAKTIVEQHGGTIGFDTTLNKGSTFYFTLPLQKEEE